MPRSDGSTVNQQVHGLYLCYWSLMDPLCQTQSLAYLLQLAATGKRFVLITFEQPRFRLPADGRVAMRRTLQEQGIYWYPLTYHKRFPLFATGFDCLMGVVTGMVASWRHRPVVVHSRGSIPSAMALVLQRLCKLKFLYDADSRLSLEYADNGHWSRESLSYRITARVEAQARVNADWIVVLTERLREDFRHELCVQAPVEVIPCCVDTLRIQFDASARSVRRRELGLDDEKLLIYVGKLGPRYLVKETFAFLKHARKRFEDVRLLILSSDPREGFDAIAQEAEIGTSSYFVRRAGHDEVPSWLSASDAGIALIRSAECERGSSPIKIGEYLAAGLPVVLTDDIGDFSTLVHRQRIGVVLKGIDESAYLDCIGQLQNLWRARDELQSRCRAAAVNVCDLKLVGGTRYHRVYDRLLKLGLRR